MHPPTHRTPTPRRGIAPRPNAVADDRRCSCSRRSCSTRVFVLYPIVQSARYSLYDWNGLEPARRVRRARQLPRAFSATPVFRRRDDAQRRSSSCCRCCSRSRSRSAWRCCSTRSSRGGRCCARSSSLRTSCPRSSPASCGARSSGRTACSTRSIDGVGAGGLRPRAGSPTPTSCSTACSSSSRGSTSGST